MKDVFTIGYFGFNIDDFVKALKKYKVNSLIDVRSNPNSKYYEDYNSSNLQRVLKLNGIIYRNYKVEFGARQEDLQYYPNGYLDFEIFVQSEQFIEGMKKIEAGMELDYTFAFMCAEKDPSTQLAAFTKYPDIEFFLKEINEMEYIHDAFFSPEEYTLKRYKKKEISWEQYVIEFNDTMDKRNISQYIQKNYDMNKRCCLLCSEATAVNCHRSLVAKKIRSVFDEINIIHL